MRRGFLALLGLSLATFTGGARAADTTGVTPTSIKIGVFGPLTGPAAVFSKSLLGAVAIYKDVNDHGGVNGRKIDLVIEDDGCDPNKGISAVKKLVSQDQVFMIHGGWCSNVVLACKPELTRNPSLPYMVLGAASVLISTPVVPNVFHPVATTATVARTMVDFGLTKPGAKRIGIISHSDEWGKSHLEPAYAEIKAKGGEAVETVYFERGSSDATSQVLRLRGAKPDVVLAILYPAELAIYLRDAYKYGLHVPAMGTQGVSIEDTEKRVGIPAAVKDLYVFYPLSAPIDSPKLAKWAAIFKKYNPNETLDTISFISMSGSLAVLEALKRLGPNVTREGFIQQLDNLRDFDPGIQSAPMTFTPTDHAGIKSGKMIHLVNGKAELVDRYPAGSASAK